MKKKLFFLGLLFCVTTVFAQTYKPGDKVEVLADGEWAEGVYTKNLGEIYSNMKATPHKVAYKNICGSKEGSGNFKDADIRAFTGTLKAPYTPQAKPSSVNTNTLENDIIREVNEMRTNPKAYAQKLAKLKTRYVEACGSWYLDMPQEGGVYLGKTAAKRKSHEQWLDETIADLNKSPVLSQLTKDGKLRIGSDYLASDGGKVNGPKHLDSQGRTANARAKVAGYTHGVNECLMASKRTGFGVVAGFLIDWNVESRGHRKNLMSEQANDIGVACHLFREKVEGEWVTEAFIRTVIQCGMRQVDDTPTNNNTTSNNTNSTSNTSNNNGNTTSNNTASTDNNNNTSNTTSPNTTETSKNGAGVSQIRTNTAPGDEYDCAQSPSATSRAGFLNVGALPIKLYWHSGRRDNLLAVTEEGERIAKSAGYKFIEEIGYAFKEQTEGTVPMKIYWHPQRQDNMMVCSKKEEDSATAEGYRFIRVEGYIFEKSRNGTCPLYLFWNESRKDGHTTTAEDAEGYARYLGYSLIIKQGYIFIDK